MRTCVKINLGLQILGRREDGFHNLETLFVPCDQFGDELDIEPLADGDTEAGEAETGKAEAGITGNGAGSAGTETVRERGRQLAAAPDAQGSMRRAELPDGSIVKIWPCSWDPAQDLTVKALNLLKRRFDIPPVHIRLKKGAPVGAGLGGGSADAAAALMLLNERFGLGLSREELAAEAALLGSDCAFFIYGRPMFGEGRGELLSEADAKFMEEFVIKIEVPDNEAVSTKEAYRGIWDAVQRTYPQGRVSLREVLKLPAEEWQGRLVNDFELTVLPEHPAIARLKRKMLEDGAVYASMSGSGSAVFGLFKREGYEDR